jgi:cytochrome c556
MKSTFLALSLLFAVTLSAQDDEFVSGMKTTKAAMDALQKMEKKTGPQAVAAGEKLGSVYENMIPFWRQRMAADAVKWSEEGKSAAVMFASAASADDGEKAAAALKTIGGTCKSCHDAHREKTPEGKYKIK